MSSRSEELRDGPPANYELAYAAAPLRAYPGMPPYHRVSALLRRLAGVTDTALGLEPLPSHEDLLLAARHLDAIAEQWAASVMLLRVARWLRDGAPL